MKKFLLIKLITLIGLSLQSVGAFADLNETENNSGVSFSTSTDFSHFTCIYSDSIKMKEIDKGTFKAILGLNKKFSDNDHPVDDVLFGKSEEFINEISFLGQMKDADDKVSGTIYASKDILDPVTNQISNAIAAPIKVIGIIGVVVSGLTNTILIATNTISESQAGRNFDRTGYAIMDTVTYSGNLLGALVTAPVRIPETINSRIKNEDSLSAAFVSATLNIPLCDQQSSSENKSEENKDSE